MTRALRIARTCRRARRAARPLPAGWWILPGAVLGLLGWAAILGALALVVL